MFQQDVKQFLDCEMGSTGHKDLLVLLDLAHDSSMTVVKYKPATEYHCYYKQGIAFMFEQQRLDAVEYYKPRPSGLGVTPPKYAAVTEQRVPSDIGYCSTAKQLVDTLGEPTEKGGGRGKTNIWLRWDSGIEVEIPCHDWDVAKNTEWSGLTIFRK